jgi:hypothetical protein
MGAVVLCIRVSAICAIVLVGSVGAGEVRSAYVASDPTAPPTGGLVWHWTHLVKAGATSHGRPVVPLLPLLDVAVVPVLVVPVPVLVGGVPASELQLPIGTPEMIQSETVLICAAVLRRQGRRGHRRGGALRAQDRHLRHRFGRVRRRG